MRSLTFASNSRWALRYQDNNLDLQTVNTTLQERRNVLQAQLNAWFKFQAAYIPVAQYLQVSQRTEGVGFSGHDEGLEDASWLSTDIVAEKAKLFLPSQFPPSLWSTGCMPKLHEMELKMRIAQTTDALEQLKQHLCIFSSFVRYKILQVSGPGQKANTCARNISLRLREKVTRCAERYRASRAALEILDSSGDWQDILKPLLESDIQGPNGGSPDDVVVPMSKRSKRSKRTGEGFRQISWIWRVRRPDLNTNSEGLGNAEGSRRATVADVDKCEFSYFRDLLYWIQSFIIRSKSRVCKGEGEGVTLARRSPTSCRRNAKNVSFPAVESTLVEESSGRAPRSHWHPKRSDRTPYSSGSPTAGLDWTICTAMAS